MTDLLPYGCHIPFQHVVHRANDVEALHYWIVSGAAGSMTLHTIQVSGGIPALPSFAQHNGDQWLGADLTFHAVSPISDHDHYFPRCTWIKRECWASYYLATHAMRLTEAAFRSDDPERFIRRVLTGLYDENEDKLEKAKNG